MKCVCRGVAREMHSEIEEFECAGFHSAATLCLEVGGDAWDVECAGAMSTAV